MRTIIVVALLAAGCGKNGHDACADRRGGALVTLDIAGEGMRVWSTNDTFIAKAVELQASGKPHVAMFERLIDGKDCDQWSWHVDPALMGWPDVTTEVCDGKPSDIEKDKPYWLNTVKRYCPWSTIVRGVVERRATK